MPPAPSPGFSPHAPSWYTDIPGLGHIQVASIGQRIFARLIDIVVVLVTFGSICLVAVALLIGQNAASANDVTGRNTPGLGIAAAVVFLLALVFSWTYDAIMTGKFGATFGKRAVRIEVVDQHSGRAIGVMRATIRNVIPYVGGLLCGIGSLIVYASVLFDNSGRLQGWHDKAAKDLVIQSRPRLPQ